MCPPRSPRTSLPSNSPSDRQSRMVAESAPVAAARTSGHLGQHAGLEVRREGNHFDLRGFRLGWLSASLPKRPSSVEQHHPLDTGKAKMPPDASGIGRRRAAVNDDAGFRADSQLAERSDQKAASTSPPGS